MAYEIKTLGIGGILDSTFRLFRDHFKFVVIVTAALYFPIALALTLSQALISPDTYPLGAAVQGLQETPASVVAEMIGSLSTLVLSVFGTLLEGAMVYGIAMLIGGQRITPGEAIGRALRCIVALLVIKILYIIGVLTGSILLIIPGIIFALMWYIVVPVYMIEGTPLLMAFSRSAKLMNGHKSKAFNVAVLIGLVAFGTSMSVVFIPNPYAVALATAMLESLFASLVAIAATVIYFSARCANENLDLELLATSMEEQVPQENASPL